MRMTRQELFDQAVAEYDHMVAFLRANAKVIREALPGYPAETVPAQFDSILQGLLLKVGFADAELCRYEIQFIQKITDHQNILEDGFKIPDGGQKEAKKLFEQRADRILEKAAGFFGPIAKIDVCFPEIDFFDIIRRHLTGIVAAFCAMDDRPERDEFETATETIETYIAKPYRAVKDATEKFLSGKCRAKKRG